MAIDMSQFYQVFFDESAEHLAAMESLLLELDVAHPDQEALNAIFRAAHSIKGSAGTFGFNDLAETTHQLENLLDRIRKSELALRRDMVDTFLDAGDVLHEMLEAHQGRGTVDAARVVALGERLRQLATGEVGGDRLAPQPDSSDSPQADGALAVTAAQTADCRDYEIEFVPTRHAAEGAGVANLLEDLAMLGQLEIQLKPDETLGRWVLRLSTAAPRDYISDQVDFIAENGAWRIAEFSGATLDAMAKAPEEDVGYGFFEPLPDSISPHAAPQSVQEDPGYGFFTDIVDAGQAPPASTVEEEAGYGFFVPVGGGSSAPPEVVSPAVEEGDGFGFFAPLPPKVEPLSIEIVASPVIDSPPALVRVDEGASSVQAKKSAAPAVQGADSSIRVSVDKVDQLINLVGELVITQAMLLQTAHQMTEVAPERLLNGLAQLERNTRDLQASVMSIRMLPISFVFSRFPRVVRDLSARLGKQVDLKTSGETTEVDKGLIERIADPLTHLIRNSLDHGIESPDKRLAAGKRATGTITLKAYHQGGNIVIEVGDDGAGLPRDKILAKARERGLPVSEQMSDQEVFNLIFEAGFSTAEQVTDVSGRGVGMDVVRRNIQSMGGRIEIESMLGIGTRMTVRLPLTLAILEGMSVAVGNQTYILPLSYVIESLQPHAGDIRTLANCAQVIQVRGEYLPVLALHEVFSLPGAVSDATQGIIVVLDANGMRVALLVDALLGQHQVVIKSLEANFRKVPGVSGATIMGDGHVALILDAPAIAGMARNIMYQAA